MSVSEFVDAYLRYAIVPAWLIAGLADWACHRRAHIERNAGAKESAMHLAQMLEVGIPLLVALIFRINAIVIAIMLLGLILHEITALWDVHYAKQKRDIGTIEQHAHSFLELLPICAVTLVIGANAERVWRAIVHASPQDWTMSPSPVPLPYIGGVVTAAILFAVIPYGEELVRCVRHPRQAARQRAAQTTLYAARTRAPKRQ